MAPGLTLLFLSCFVAAQGVSAALPKQERPCQTALQTVAGLPGLDKFLGILKQTRLAGLLDDPAFPATVFAVRNDVLPGLSRLLSSNSTLATEQVRAVAHYHVLPFSLSKAIRYNATAKHFTTMLGQAIGLQQAAVRVIVGTSNSSILLSSQPMPACQAEVYVVDGILIPDLDLAANVTSSRAAAQGLKSVRATASRRLLAREDSSSKATSHSTDKSISHSHTGHNNATHHHGREDASSLKASSGKGKTMQGAFHDSAAHHHPASEDATSSGGLSMSGRKSPADSKPQAGVSADGKESQKQLREAEAERQALAVPEITSQEGGGSSSKGNRQELSTLTTGSGEGLADSKHTTVSAGSRADKQEPKDELDSLGATTPEDLSEDGQVGAEAADHSKAAGAGAAKKAAAASKTLENDLQAVYSHSHKAGKKGTGAGVLKSIMGIFSGGEPSESEYQRGLKSDFASKPNKASSKAHADKASRSRRSEDDVTR